jgi:cadmium resistance protein CadD (predicted permease)
MLASIGLAVVLFVTTNVDDVFVLLGFFADPRVRARQIVAGQYLGIATLVALSALASTISLVLAPPYVGLLGVVPILLGAKMRADAWRGTEPDEDAPPRAGLGTVAAIAAVTIANGGDNVGVYTPVFATATLAELAIVCGVFAVLIAAWVALARWLVSRPALRGPIRQLAPRVVPWVLIAIGVWVLDESGSWSLLR